MILAWASPFNTAVIIDHLSAYMHIITSATKITSQDITAPLL